MLAGSVNPALEAMYLGTRDTNPLFTLKTRLARATDRIEKQTGSRFFAVAEALFAMREFLESVDELRDVALPIDVLILALCDAMEGRSHSLFKEVHPGRLKDSSTTEHSLHLQVALAVEVLKAVSFSYGKAFEIVADTLHRAGVRQRDESPINARLIKEWRSRVSGVGASRDNRKFLEQLRTQLAEMSPSRTTAKRTVERIANKIRHST